MPCVLSLQFPAARRLIRNVDQGVASTPYVELILTNDFLISRHSVNLLVVPTANNIVAGVAALPGSSVKT